MAAFSQFASDLDEDTKQRIARGRLLTEVLKQKQYAPLSVAEQVIMLMAATGGAFDHLMNHNVEQAVRNLMAKLNTAHPQIVTSLNEGTKPEEADVKTILDEARRIADTFKGAEE